MKKYFYILAALSIVPNLSLAQAGNFDAEVDQELDQMYSNKQAGSVASPAPVSASVAGTAGQGSQPIYILNQATPSATAQTQTSQVQKQPITLVESSPLVESKAEMMRKSRQDAEVQTEQRIVEKLEASRLDDEKRRADVLFGNKFEQMQGASTQIKAENSNVSVTTGQQAVQSPVVVQAAPVVTPVEPKENLRDVVREELKNSMKVEAPVEATPEEVKYFAAIAGIGDYPDVRNVRGNYSVGAAFGTKYDQLIVEGSFLLSNYTVEKIDCNCVNSYYPTLVDTNQYQAAVAAKYQLMSGLVRPVVGGLVSYSYRKYDWTNMMNAYPYNNNYGTSSDSHAIDLGVTAGVDLELNKKFALGFEYRYMFNLSSRVDNQSIVTGSQYGTPIEKLSYYTLALAAKVNF